jgi:hypothetical protein
MPNQYKVLKKLGTGYVRPSKTASENLTPEEIESKLEDYIQTDIEKIPLNTHIRYFKMEDGKRKFCPGGILYQNVGIPTYVKLSNGSNVWSVQVKDTIFFRKMAPIEISTEYKKQINELDDKVKHIVKKNEILEAENKKLIDYIKKISTEYKKHINELDDTDIHLTHKNEILDVENKKIIGSIKKKSKKI